MFFDNSKVKKLYILKQILSCMNVKKILNEFVARRKGSFADERFSSFDYCNNYFRSFSDSGNQKDLYHPDNLEESCLQLGFYLASWGMFRGSSFLLRRSARNFSELMQVIGDSDPKLWEIDVPDYDPENIKLLLDTKQKIIGALDSNNKPSDTLVTKIMLGVYGNIPAFDQYFRKSLGVFTVNKNSLRKVQELYQTHKADFDSFRIPTIDFLTARPTENIYSKAKLIDICGFIDGQ